MGAIRFLARSFRQTLGCNTPTLFAHFARLPWHSSAALSNAGWTSRTAPAQPIEANHGQRSKTSSFATRSTGVLPLEKSPRSINELVARSRLGWNDWARTCHRLSQLLPL